MRLISELSSYRFFSFPMILNVGRGRDLQVPVILNALCATISSNSSGQTMCTTCAVRSGGRSFSNTSSRPPEREGVGRRFLDYKIASWPRNDPTYASFYIDVFESIRLLNRTKSISLYKHEDYINFQNSDVILE